MWDGLLCTSAPLALLAGVFCVYLRSVFMCIYCTRCVLCMYLCVLYISVLCVCVYLHIRTYTGVYIRTCIMYVCCVCIDSTVCNGIATHTHIRMCVCIVRMYVCRYVCMYFIDACYELWLMCLHADIAGQPSTVCGLRQMVTAGGTLWSTSSHSSVTRLFPILPLYRAHTLMK